MRDKRLTYEQRLVRGSSTTAIASLVISILALIVSVMKLLMR